MPTVTVPQQPLLWTRRGALMLLLLCAVQFLDILGSSILNALRHPHPGPEQPGRGRGARRTVATSMLGDRVGQWVHRNAAQPAARGSRR
jgi:hypothetical protein